VPRLALVLLAALLPATARAGTQAQVVLDELVVGLRLTPWERLHLTDPVDRFERLGGHLGHVRNTTWIATLRGCRAACLVTALTGVADAMQLGMSDMAGADFVLDQLDRTLGELGPAPEPVELEQRLREAIREGLRAWSAQAS
jgi:hypothetical protein